MATSIRTGGKRGWIAGAALLLLPASASASLGGDVDSVELDRAQMNGERIVVSAPGCTVHEIRVPGGTLVREYVSSDGVVFGLAWRGPFRPDVQRLLGPYFDAFRDEAQALRRKRGGRGPIAVERPDLVVFMGGHARAFVGRAYDPRLLPQGFAPDRIE